MGRCTGYFLGMITMMGLAYIFSTNRRAIRVEDGGVGIRVADSFSRFCVEIGIWAAAVSEGWRGGELAA